MERTINLTKLELLEESIYKYGTIIFLSSSVSAFYISLHMLLAGSGFSYLFISLFLISTVLFFVFTKRKAKRFGHKNYSLAERIFILEQTIGTAVN